MKEEKNFRTVKWVDLSSPTKTEMRKVMDEIGIDASVAREFLTPSPGPAMQQYDHGLFLVLHFPMAWHTHSGKAQELNIFVKEDAVVVCHYETIDALHKFSKHLDVEEVINHSFEAGDSHGVMVFFALLRKMYRSVYHELEILNDELESIEDEVFKGREREMVIEISKLSRVTLDFHQWLRTHEPIMRDLPHLITATFGEKFAPIADMIVDDYIRVRDENRDAGEIVDDLRATNDSLLSSKQNEAMKTLTIMAFVALPLSVVAALFGMNTATTPLVGQPGDFWLVIMIMAALTMLFFAYFKYRHWL